MAGLRRLSAVVAIAGFAACLGTGGDGPGQRPDRQLSWERVPDQSVALRDGDQVLWRFHHDPSCPQAFFHPLALPKLPPLTRDRPSDHVWHHGLWFSWKKINGVNYWEHVKGKDHPAGRTRWTVREIETRPDYSASIRMAFEYTPEDSAPVLAEERSIQVSAPDENGSYRIQWTSCFTAIAKKVVLDRTPLPGEPGGKVYGGYAGLSLRLANLEERAAATVEGPVAFNPQNRFRTRSTGLDYSGLLDGRPVGIAILDHPTNLNAPTPWYVIRSASMSFFTPAVICLGPKELHRGERFSLYYRVVVHPGRWDSDRLRAESERFSREPAVELTSPEKKAR